MPCIAAPKLPIPSGLDLLLPSLSLSVPSPTASVGGLQLCCNFEPPPIPGFPIIVPLGPILGPLATVVDTVLAVVTAVIDLLNALLDQLQFDCPLE